MEKHDVLAIDLGASSGRVIRAQLRGGFISLEEFHRFANTPVTRDGQLQWDYPRLLDEIKRGIQIAEEEGFESIGIDTWGVDFALIEPDGMIVPPVCYRDKRTKGLRKKVFAKILERELFQRTGLQAVELNTLFQLVAAKPRAGQTILLMPDFFGWLLTGNVTAEKSMASTTQLINQLTQDWDFELIDLLGFPKDCFPKTTDSGVVLGEYASRPVISILGHDTASATLAVPAKEASFLYISCGTWSIVGTERESAVCSDEAFAFGLSNEIGFGGKAELLRNITGLWLMQEARRCLQERDGRAYSYSELEAMAASQFPFQFLIDPDDAIFSAPGDMPARIRKYCNADMTDTQILRCIYDSLALKHKWAVEGIEAVTNERYEKIYMVGGGTQSALLCQMTANVLGRPVIAGPVEATAIGNAAVQLITLGHIADAADARNIIRESFPVIEYKPEEISTDAYMKFLAMMKRRR